MDVIKIFALCFSDVFIALILSDAPCVEHPSPSSPKSEQRLLTNLEEHHRLALIALIPDYASLVDQGSYEQALLTSLGGYHPHIILYLEGTRLDVTFATPRLSWGSDTNAWNVQVRTSGYLIISW